MSPHTAPGSDAGWYEVQLTVPWPVANVETAQDAINVAVAEVGRRAQRTDIRSSDITVRDVACPSCGHRMEAALCAAEYALVVLEVTVEVKADSLEKSGKIAKRELGKHIENIPFSVVDTRPIGDETDQRTSFGDFNDANPESPVDDHHNREHEPAPN